MTTSAVRRVLLIQFAVPVGLAAGAAAGVVVCAVHAVIHRYPVLGANSRAPEQETRDD